ncbi:unnamed protein product [Microthlaspi erraticum]|uniref:Uncharacterized protein n=1 Tax=Microthlaspi erraticum TaxID=1685480 RepID=A0A6D2J066_9BRAS|nr:unnamed protein product [Microthlaspi erraticum]
MALSQSPSESTITLIELIFKEVQEKQLLAEEEDGMEQLVAEEGLEAEQLVPEESIAIPTGPITRSQTKALNQELAKSLAV